MLLIVKWYHEKNHLEKLAFGNPHFSWKLSELLLILVAKEEDFDNLDDLEASSESCGEDVRMFLQWAF